MKLVTALIRPEQLPAVKTSLHEAGFVTRLYYLNSAGDYNAAKELKANILATDMVNDLKYPWTVTHDRSGYPFQQIEQK